LAWWHYFPFWSGLRITTKSAIAKLNSVHEIVAQDPQNPDLLSHSHNCCCLTFNSSQQPVPGSLLKFHLFINQLECSPSMTRSKIGTSSAF
jgi:hypothetical protein